MIWNKKHVSCISGGWKQPSAFTLVELIVVITILAVLATVGFLALQGYTKDAKDSATKTNVRTVAQAVELESAAGGASVRRFASFSGAYAMSGKVLGATLSGGSAGTAGTNYTPGPIDFAALKLDGSKFAADGSQYLMSAVDVPEKLVTGKTRTRTLFQIAALAGTTAYVEGTFSSALVASGSGTATETTVTGIIADPASPGGAVALTSNLDAPVAGGSAPVTPTGPTDPYYANVTFLMKFEGADGGTAFTDLKWGLAINRSNPGSTTTAITATDQKMFWSSSVYFDRDLANNGLYTASTDVMAFTGWQDFTVEAFARSNGFSSYDVIISTDVMGVAPGNTTPGGLQVGSVWNQATAGWHGIDFGSYGGTIPLNTWVHIAASRSGGKLRIYIDGVLKDVRNNTSVYPSGVLWIGNDPHSTWWKGHIDSIRVTKWVGRYTGDTVETQYFTPPAEDFPGS